MYVEKNIECKKCHNKGVLVRLKEKKGYIALKISCSICDTWEFTKIFKPVSFKWIDKNGKEEERKNSG